MKDLATSKWKTAPLASIAKVFTDGNWIETKDQSTDGIRLVQTGNIGDGIFKDRREKARWIDQDTFFRLNCFEVLPGDCLISRLPDPVGRACLIPDTGNKMITSVDCSIIRPDEGKIDSRFLVYFTQSQQYLRDVEGRCSGTTRERISRKNLGKVLIPLPPLGEQQRIVAVLDDAFEGLVRARAHAEANVADAEQIAARSLDAIIEDLSTRNGRIAIDGIAAVKGGKRLPKGSKPDPDPTGYPYISVKDLTEDGTVSTAKLGYISKQVQRSIARYTISSRDVYISIAGTIGKSGIVPDELDGANLTENAAKLVLKEGWSTEYVYWCTRSADFAIQTSEQTRVAAQPKLALQRLGAIEIPKANQTEQIDLCEKMNALRSTRSELVESYKEKLQNIHDLRQSLLQKAFAGELR